MEQERAPLSPPGFWIGWPELVFFILSLGVGMLSTLIAENPRDVQGFAILAAVPSGSVLAGITYYLLVRRHRARSGAVGDGPFFRVRDLVMFAQCGLVGTLCGAQVSWGLTMNQPGAAAVAFVSALVDLLVTSKVWGSMAGPRSGGWGIFALLGGGGMLLMVVAVVGMLGSALGDDAAIVVYASGLAMALIGVAWILGGVALFKEPSERGSLAAHVCLALGGASCLAFAGDLLLWNKVISGEIDIRLIAGHLSLTPLFLLAALGAFQHRSRLTEAAAPAAV